jgi:hypothetical protein
MWIQTPTQNERPASCRGIKPSTEGINIKCHFFVRVAF